VAQSAPAFTLFGFPVHVRAGFLLFMVLVVTLNGTEFGLPLALLMALFTLLHELGHAFAARATGARAEIALDFLAGYASFAPTRPLTKAERIGISLAGPLAQIAAGSALYFALGGEWWHPQPGHTPLQMAAWWAGPIIGLFNLIPILPLDGGNVLQVLIEVVAPRHARRVMYGVTIALAGAAIAWMVIDPDLQPLIVFAAIPLITVAQMISNDRQHSRRADGQEALARAEALAWASGDYGRFPGGAVPSPWARAWQHFQHGQPEAAREVLLADLADTAPVNWWPPDAAPVDALRQLVALLPADLPAGRSYSAFVLGNVLLRTGEAHRAGLHAAAAYGTHRSPMLALQVARAAAALGDRATALAWLATSARNADRGALRAAVAQAPEFDTLRHDPDVAAAVAG